MNARSSEGTNAKKTANYFKWFAAVALLIPALLMPSTASAEPGWNFEPESKVTASTYQAGAHPNLTIKTNMPLTECIRTVFDDWQGDLCVAFSQQQQNLKAMTVRMPPGLAADANAAPYCDPEQILPNTIYEEDYPRLWWRCRNDNKDAQVGRVLITAQYCDLAAAAPTTKSSPYFGCFQPYIFEPGNRPPETIAAHDYGTVFNARPRTEGPYAGEQGHLIVLWPYTPGIGNLAQARTDISIVVRDSDVGINTRLDELTDTLDHSGIYGLLPGHMVEMEFTLRGTTGLEQGHPLLTNPTFCEPQAIDFEYQGYLENTRRIWGWPNLWTNENVISHSGTSEAVKGTAPYTATGCDTLPYAPTFAASSDTDAPGKPVALTTTITQKDNEATTKKVDVEFPKGMGINLGTSLKPCAAETPNRSNCPDAFMGAVEAESRLLPNGETLKGDVFLTGQKGNRLSLAVLLSGFVDLRFNATAGVDSSGRLTASFDDLPSVPLTKFTLNLAGGDKSLITNPRRCGDLTTKATFTSHSGKTRVVSVPAAIQGCSAPAFDVELSEPSKGKRTGIELEVRSDQKPIKEVKFGIDRHMKLSAKGLGKKRKFGEISVTSDSGMKEAALKRSLAAREKNKAFSLKVSALEGLGVNIYRKRFKRKGVKNFKNKKNKKALKKKTVLKNRVSVKPLPKDNPTKVSVSLNPDETKLLRNGKNKCRVNFIALIKTTDGVKYALKQTVKLRGKGCSKKKAKKKKS